VVSPKLVEVGRHLNIALHTLSTVEKISGEAGNFQVTVKKAPRYVDMDKCIACGACTKKCPGKSPDEFNEGLDKRKAIYVPYPQAVPLKYVIDPGKCFKLLKDKCGNCAKVCPTGAVNYEDQEEILDLNVGSVILAPGFKPYDPKALDNYQYSKFSNVVTAIEFERILSAGGPTGGHIECQPDKHAPKKIAWLQCIGSRDQNKCDNKYCSSVCCMYAVKEAMMARDHVEGEFEASIFLMDMRTFGKDFEKYYERAKSEGVRFVRSRIHTIVEETDKRLTATYATEGGENVTETFDMIVLSVGMETPPELAREIRDLGVELNEHNFVETSSFAPVSTSREGFYVCGALQEPKDIPLAVMEASAAACDAGAALFEARNSLTKAKTYPEEADIAGREPRIGVFVCNCGTNIGGIVDVPGVAEYAKGLPNVVYVEENMFTCSQDTQDKMKAVIRENDLNRIVVAACTPRTHEALFQETLKDSGLNKYLVEMANIRNQCSWVHAKEPEKATEKARDLVRIAVAKAALMRPLTQPFVGINQKGLVIGGGVAGLTAALGLARQGFPAVLVEQKDVLGGNALYLNHTWKGESIQDNVQGLVKEAREHPLIEIYTDARVTSTSGFIGNFKTSIEAGKEAVLVEHGAVIVATGAGESWPEEYLYGEDDRILTHLELDVRLREDEAGLKAKQSAVFIQCVGSRDEKRPYCSKVCCTHTVKSALKLKALNPDMDVYVLNRDIRTYGQRELLYQKAREEGVIFIRYDLDHKPLVQKREDDLFVRVKDHVLDMTLQINTDLLVLATAIEAGDNAALARMFKLTLNSDSFFMEAHAKLRPVDFATDGIFLAGMAHYPKPVEESIAQAKAAVSRAIVVLSKDKVVVDGVVSSINPALCRACGACEEACAFGAVAVVEDESGRRVAKVQQALCKGCAACASACPTGAAGVYHYDNEIMAQVEAALPN
jgi:heterodisulfide reductase subunit A